MGGALEVQAETSTTEEEPGGQRRGWLRWGEGAPSVHWLQASDTPPPRNTWSFPHLTALPANVSHANHSKANKDCPSQLTLRSSNPNPKGSLGLEFRDELPRGGWGRKVGRRNPADLGCIFAFQGGQGPDSQASCPEPRLTPPQALPGLPDSEGGVTQGALTACSSPGDLSSQFPHICHVGI